MRVTATVRDFITKEVRSRILADESIVEEYNAAKARATEMEEICCDRITDFGRAMIASRLGELGEGFSYNVRWGKCDFEVSNITFGIPKEIEKKFGDEERRISALRKEKISEIIVTLELGGNKKDLMELLEKIG